MRQWVLLPLNGDSLPDFKGGRPKMGPSSALFRCCSDRVGPALGKGRIHGLYAMSPYVHVRNEARYPAVLLLAGANDPRVGPGQMGKMTARLQTATRGGKPVLLRVSYESGHGVGSTWQQKARELDDELSFLLWQFGEPAFQPVIGH